MTTVKVTTYSFSGTGSASIYTGRPDDVALPLNYNSAMNLVETTYTNPTATTYKVTILNATVVRVTFTVVPNPDPKAGVFKSFYAVSNGFYFTFDFSSGFNTCNVTYSGPLNNLRQIGTTEKYTKLLTSSKKLKK